MSNGVTKHSQELMEILEKSSRPLNAQELLFKYLYYLPLFLFSLGLTLLGAWVYLRYKVPVYNVSSKIIIKNENSNSNDEALEKVMVFKKAVNLQNEIEIMKSRKLMRRVVDSLGLNTTYFTKGKIKTSEIYNQAPFVFVPLSIADSSASIKYTFRFLSENQFKVNGDRSYFLNQVFRSPAGEFKLVPRRDLVPVMNMEYIVSWSPSDQVASDLVANLNVRVQPGGATILEVNYSTPNNAKGIDIINRLIKEYDYVNVEDKNRTGKSTISFIDERLNLIAGELDSVERKLENFKSEDKFLVTISSGNTGGGLSKSTASSDNDYESQISGVQLKIELLNLLDTYIRNRTNQFNLVPTNLGIEDQVLSGLIGGFNELVLKRNRFLQNYVPESSAAIADLESQIEAMRIKMLEDLKNVRESFRLSLNSIEKSNTKYISELQSLPKKERALREIERQRGVKEELVLYLRKKREESAISLASTVSNTRLIDNAVSSSVPISPNRSNVYRIAILLGLIFPVLIIYGIDLLNDKITTRKDIIKVLNTPIIGEVGHNDDPSSVIITKRKRNMVAEQFRVIRTNLSHTLAGIKCPSILVTSSVSGEGKSFISTNIAAVMALSGKKTVLLEFDLRKPKIVSTLKLNRKIGLTNFLVGNASLEELAIPISNVENLDVISCGPTPPNPAEILLHSRMNDLFNYLREKYECIVIDTAP
ncbi:MAG: polysaccharide biosynthesis tyrosine autokinase, partial [Sphingobacteriales bacterium]|nr:polysaccharide biosynthesis tyrosine autokinase [Sphingobacteriales bacterium]